MAPERLSPRTFKLSDQGLILPAALRAPKGITKIKTIGAYILVAQFRPHVSLADPTAARAASSGRNEPFVTNEKGAR